MSGPILGRTGNPCEIQGGIDQPDVAERLRKITEHSPPQGIVFLGQQADIVAESAQPFEQTPCVVVTAEQNEDVGEPEAAGEERPFAGRQTVVSGARVIPQHETVAD